MSDVQRLSKILADPPKAFSPAPIWWWSGDPLEIDRLRWQMDRFAEGGVYNLVLLNLAPTGPLYGADPDQPRFFSEAWWEILSQVCAYAGEKGIAIWIYDQIGFSGANIQGDIVRERPEYAGRSLASVHVEGEGPLEAVCPSNGTPLAAGAVPIGEDGKPAGPVTPVAIENGAARFEASGRHRLRLAYSVQKGFDYFNPGACRRLLDVVHGAYEARVGKYFGKAIAGSFQDELPSMPSWGPDFAEQFAARWGYRIEPHLIALWEGEDETARKVRVHYHRLRAELAEEALFKPLFEWHERNGLICGFDQQSPSRAGEPNATVRQYADYMATHRWYQAPGSDHHGEAKIHSSLAHLYGRKRVWIEAFHSSGWGGTIEETFDWLLPWIRAGATLYDPHAAYYSTRGGWWEWAPPSTCWRQPYWRHYSLFAGAVSRLCGILSEGTHVCDTGVLFPTTTVQAGLTPDAATPIAALADRAYLDLVGVMHWQRTEPGVLDRMGRDYDVLDEASTARGDVVGDTLVIGEERFRVIVTPACSVLDARTAETLLRFARAGGRWIAVGTLPGQVIGDEGGELVAEIGRAHAEGLVQLIERASDLSAALADRPPLVDAPVPTLLRRVGDAHVLFVPAAFPTATKHHRPTGQAVYYDFDPKRYARSMRVTVRGVSGDPELWDVTTGERRALKAVYGERGCEVEIPFASGPAALVVWPGGGRTGGDSPLPAAGSGSEDREAAVFEFGDRWSALIEPTIDNRFGDFAKPNSAGPFPVQTWFFEHKATPVEDWRRVQATFGVYGRYAGPLPAEELPPPGRPEGAADPASRAGDPAPAAGDPSSTRAGEAAGWRDVVYSLTRGIPHDPLHYGTLGPKAHVPEEFCRFGRVKKGEAVQFCTRVWMDDWNEEDVAYLALAAPAAKEIWVNGERIEEPHPGYLAIVPVRLKRGANDLAWRLAPEHDVPDLRSYWAIVRRPEAFARPEWITAGDEPRRDSLLRFSTKLVVPFAPVKATLQLAADAPARVVVNGVEAGRQGAFDPYNSTERAQPYEIASLRQGENEIVIEVQDLGRTASVLVDAVVLGPDGREIPVVSGGDWRVRRDGGPEAAVRLRRGQWLDPAWSHLWRRPHPLPGAMWIEERSAPDVVIPVTPDAYLPEGRVERFRWTVPPGATKAILPVEGEIELWVDGELAALKRAASSATVYEAALPHPDGLKRTALMKVKPFRGRTGGGVFTGPVSYEWAEGAIALGDWSEQGLDAYSGAVRYRSSFELPEAADRAAEGGRLILDLGEVRGTAEVWVNGSPAGARVWSPYRFDITGTVRRGSNDVEILVCNTLGPYLKAASPTPYVFPGQERSGIRGPVRIVRSS